MPATKAVATAAMRALLAGPNADELAGRPAMYTSIPDGTRLLDLAIKDGVATVNLSTEFKDAAREFQGATANAEVVYTLTQFSDGGPRADPGRRPAAVFGALGRDDFPGQGRSLPAIFVDRPAWGASIGNPAPVSGLANVFEATFRVQLRDAKGDVVADEPGDGLVRHGLLGHVPDQPLVHGQQGPVRHAAGVRPVREGRFTRERDRVQGLAHAGGLTRSSAARAEPVARSTRTAGSIRSVDPAPVLRCRRVQAIAGDQARVAAGVGRDREDPVDEADPALAAQRRRTPR